MIYSKAGRLLKRLLIDVEGWSFGKYTATHEKSGLTYWIANGASFFDGYYRAGTPQHLGIIERFLLWGHIKRMMNRMVAMKIQQQLDTKP